MTTNEEAIEKLKKLRKGIEGLRDHPEFQKRGMRAFRFREMFSRIVNDLTEVLNLLEKS